LKYDIFISYCSEDRLWARKLEAGLSARGVNCFLDQSRLNKGEKWEPQLLDALLDSRSFVVLWSQNARNSDWVSEELVRFKGHIDPKGIGHPLPGRLLYAINLEGHNATLNAYQGFVNESLQKAYKDNALDAAQESWDSMIAELVAASRANDAQIQELPVSILTLTTDIFTESPPVKPEFDFVTGHGVDDFLLSLGVEKMSELVTRYGTSPLEWRPFGSSETIKELLEKLLSDPKTGINVKLAELHKPPIRWAPLDVVSPQVNQLINVAQPLLHGPCLVVIDPISLFSFRIWQRYVTLAPCFSNPQAAIVFLTTVGSDQRLECLRQCIAEQGKPNLDWFHAPIPFNPDYANCGINVADRWDIRRLVLASLGRQPSLRRPSGAESILNV
jgi:hypothetical protein